MPDAVHGGYGNGRRTEMMIPSEVGLFILVALLGLLVWYIETHSEEKPRYKKPKRRP